MAALGARTAPSLPRAPPDIRLGDVRERLYRIVTFINEVSAENGTLSWTHSNINQVRDELGETGNLCLSKRTRTTARRRGKPNPTTRKHARCRHSTIAPTVFARHIPTTGFRAPRASCSNRRWRRPAWRYASAIHIRKICRSSSQTGRSAN